MTGAAPPPPSVLAQIEQGFEITHTYGLTEVYGPAVVCEFQNDWKKLKPNLIARINPNRVLNTLACLI